MKKVELLDRHDILKTQKLRVPTVKSRKYKVDAATCASSDQASIKNFASSKNKSVDSDFQKVTCKDYSENSPCTIRGDQEAESPGVESPNRRDRRGSAMNHLRYLTLEFSQQCEVRNKLERRSSTELILTIDRQQGPIPKIFEQNENLSQENTPLLQKKTTRKAGNRQDSPPRPLDIEAQQLEYNNHQQNLNRLAINSKAAGRHPFQCLGNPKPWISVATWKSTASASVEILPAVILGLLLNILDALSYGTIIFPIGQAPFEKLGPAGISIFYVSCIISQLVFSCGGSGFRGGVGSEMIEVIPFFHSMTATILKDMGDSSPPAIIATTIVAYASSSILTGILFFLFGYFHIGYIVGFIPRHVLIGCIGGIGWFLVATGVEVTANLDKLEYAVVTLNKLFHTDTLPFWTIPLGLATFQIYTDRLLEFKYYLPAFILLIPVIFYTIIASFSDLEVSNLRRAGWVFHGPEDGEPWWYFYTFYNFSLVNWGSIAKCVPAMFALTFFGIIHVPINVPSLAFALKKDDLDLNRELLAHGASNAISGIFGSVQNYLVYTNSLIVIKSGGGSRIGGLFIALATGVIMMIGSCIIGYIPRMMVGALIYILGFSLIIEAVWQSRKKLKRLEYLTVLVIVVVMGLYDFVVGIFVGIGLAFISLVFQTSRIPAVRASYSGKVVGSTVRRSPAQHRYLMDVRVQIQVVKLGGYIFFGTISSVQKHIQQITERDEFEQRPIRFLVIDFYHVSGMDYSAAEAFCQINRIMSRKKIQIIMSGLNKCGDLRSSLEAVGVSENGEVGMFEDMNSALESCESELLKKFYSSSKSWSGEFFKPNYLDVLGHEEVDQKFMVDGHDRSKRARQLLQVSEMPLDESSDEPEIVDVKESLRLILHIFAPLTEKNERFWLRAVPFFEKKFFPANSVIFRRGAEANGFYLLQQGIMRAEYELPQGHLREKILAGTTCGELNFFAEAKRTATVTADRDCIAWLIDYKNWKNLQKKEPDVAQELMRIGLKITSERMKSITSYVLTIAS